MCSADVSRYFLRPFKLSLPPVQTSLLRRVFGVPDGSNHCLACNSVICAGNRESGILRNPLVVAVLTRASSRVVSSLNKRKRGLEAEAGQPHPANRLPMPSVCVV